MYFTLSAICISFAIFSILPRVNARYKRSLWNSTSLCNQPFIVSEKSSSSIRFAAKCVLTCVALSVPLSTTWYIRIIHLSSPCYIMRAADTPNLICDLMGAKLVTSLIVLYGYCVHNIHIRQILLPMSMAYETMGINCGLCRLCKKRTINISKRSTMNNDTSALYARKYSKRNAILVYISRINCHCQHIYTGHTINSCIATHDVFIIDAFSSFCNLYRRVWEIHIFAIARLLLLTILF